MVRIDIAEGAARVSALHARGFTSSQIRSAIARGDLQRIRKGWLMTPDAAPSVVRAVSMGGRLACLSAAQHLGLWTPEDEHLHIARPRHSGRTFGDPAGVLEHWQSAAWRERDSPVEGISEIIRQVILCCPRETAVIVIDSALNRRLITRRGLSEVLSTLPSGEREILSLVDARSESGLETICRMRLASLKVPIRSQVTIDGAGRVDLILGDRLVIEADGREWHEGATAFASDRARDLALQRMGYIVVRLSYAQIMHEWALVYASLRMLIELDEHRWRAVHRRAGLAP